MLIGLDATPLLGTRTGIGRYTAGLLGALATGPDPVVATAFSLRGLSALPGQVPPGVRVAARPAPARGLQALWARSEWPPVELLTGPLDVFHATNYVLPPLRRARGVVAIHDLNFLRRPDTVDAASARFRALVPRSIRRAGAITVLTTTMADQVRDEYRPAVPVVVTSVGVDQAWFEAIPPSPGLRVDLGLPASYVLFVGTLEPRKDLPTLLAAHSLLPDAPPLVLVGPPGWGDRVDVTGCVTPGFLPDAVLHSVVAGAAALVVPSLDEGFGIPVVEALAAGTPVVASDLAVLREVGGPHVTYAEVGHPESFATALSAVLADPGPAGPRREWAATFTWDRCAQACLSAYRQALS
ncbi:MAG: glycosyltransferase family 4 protein [Actinomycetota bacterium]|nr:glycosyltransferase family 4 protein [Actinomycetota bacterium]